MAAASAMASYYCEMDAPADSEGMRRAEYYSQGKHAQEAIDAGMGCIPTVRQDMDPVLADALGLKPGQMPTEAEIANILAGKRADGSALPVAHADKTEFKGEGGDTRHRIAYSDFAFSAPKSVSIAWAFAQTEAEKHSILQCHLDACNEAMRYMERQIGRASMGKARSGGTEAARFGWMSFTHTSSRPTLEMVNEQGDTVLHRVPVAGDMNIHSHIIVPNVMRTESGRLVAMNRDMLQNRIKEFGAVYQAVISRNLRAMGADVGLDRKTNTAYLTAIPKHIVKLFSRRSNEGREAARQYAASQGENWDTMSPGQRSALIATATKVQRQSKALSQPSDGGQAEWQARAAKAGWSHKTAVTLDPARPRPSQEAVWAANMRVGREVMSDLLENRAVIWGSEARYAMAVGMIAGNMADTRDIDRATKELREGGVKQSGEWTTLQWREVAPGVSKITTVLHERQERELIDIIRAARMDSTGNIPAATLDRSIAALDGKGGVNFQSDHGRKQRDGAHALASSGRFGLLLGAAGVGKTSLLAPIVHARQQEGWTTYGVALAWRQARSLRDAGMPKENAKALTAFLYAAKDGRIPLHDKCEVFVDEVSQIGTRQLLELARLQRQYGFSIKIIGDDRQAQSIQAGPVIELMRRAFGNEAVPEIKETIRQKDAREREIAGHFRNGETTQAIKMKRDDGTAIMVPGGYDEAVAAAAAKWAERSRVGVSVTLSAPTNAAAHDVSAAIRAIRIAKGEVKVWGERSVAVEDQNGEERTLKLAPGDRVRLFARTRGEYDDNGRRRSVMIGENGSVLTVVAARGDGLMLETGKGKRFFTHWDGLRDKESGKIRLAYGDCLTVDSAQGLTSHEHIWVMPSGSQSLQGFKAYVAASRHKLKSWLITSEGAEMREVQDRRPSGVLDPPTKDEMWANVARNLARRDLKESALAFLEAAARQTERTTRAFQAAARLKEGARKMTKPMRDRVAAQVVVRQINKAAQGIEKAMQQTARQPRPMRRYEVSESEVIAQFTDAAHAFGLRPKSIVLDGEHHYAPLEGQKDKKSGGYRAFIEGIRPTIVLHNYRTSEKRTFKVNGEIRTMSPEEAESARQRAEKAAKDAEAERRRHEASAQSRARRLWASGKPADPQHPYLVRKGVEPHGLRQDAKGSLLLPMRDAEGAMWNVQQIDAKGGKTFLPGGRKAGMYAMLGHLPREGDKLAIAEGFATAATIRQLTGMTVVVAFDSGNMPRVAEALRKAEPNRELVIFSDNDHHLARRDPPLPNVGIEKAKMAAQDTGARVVTPTFQPHEKDTDWNDVMLKVGPEAAKRALRDAWKQSEVAKPVEAAKQKAGMRM